LRPEVSVAVRAQIKFTLLSLALAVLVAVPASARREVHPMPAVRDTRPTQWIWFDDLEPADPGWTHGDVSTTASPHFHASHYMAYSGTRSWWCGSAELHGYGNNWDDRLDIPPITTAVEQTSWGSIKARYRDEPTSREGGRSRDAVYPLLTFAYRNDSEPGYDFTYVDAESAGAFVHLNRGYDGVHPWSTAAFYLGDKDSPCVCRFRFVSDGVWSDEDGFYNSTFGAFMCDEISIWDYYSGAGYFYDDVESGGLCMPSIPEAAGDYWHIIENRCKAWSNPHVWVNTGVDTPGFVPPGVRNWLMTPTVDVSGVVYCGTNFILQLFTPTVDNDYWTEEITTDGGASWTVLHVLWGDQCDVGYGPCEHFQGGDNLTPFLPAATIALRWVYYSTDNGAGPDVCSNAGIVLDDIGIYEWGTSHKGDATSWGRVRSLYR